MAYVEVTKDGKVITRRELDEEKAAGGCPIRLGPVGEITLAIGQSGKLGDYDLTVFAGPLPPAGSPRTSRPADNAPGGGDEAAVEPEKDEAISQPSEAAASEPAPEAADQAQAPSIDGYKILGPVGDASAGLWKAVQLSSQKVVALKVFPADTFASDSVRSRFAKEMKLASKLQHPNIARVYDSAGRRDKPSYCAMDLVEGLPLDRHVVVKHLAPQQIAALMKTICMAVETAHQKGLVHRHLSPSNIVVTADGQPHILDFGLPKPSDEGSPLQGALDSQAPAQPTFLAPEQASGEHDRVDARSDVYSLGAILYRLLTGKYHHDMNGLQFEVYRRIIDKDPVPARRAAKAVDDDLEALLHKALARDPAGRYANPVALAADLDNYLQCRPLNCRPRTRQYVARKFAAKHKWPLAIGGAAVVIIGIATAVYFSGAARRAGEERIKQEEDRRIAARDAERKKEEDADIARIQRENQWINETRPTTRVAAGPSIRPVETTTRPAPGPGPVGPVVVAPPVSEETAGLPTVIEWISLFDGKSLGQWKIDEAMPVPGKSGKVRIEVDSDALTLHEGKPFTGVAWMADFPTVNYEISLEATRLSGTGTFCDLTIPVGKACSSVHLGSQGGKGAGMRYIGPDGADVAAVADAAYEDTRWYEFRIRVSKQQIVCFINNEKVMETATPQFLAKAPANLPHAGRPRLLTWNNTSAAFRNLRYRRLTVAEVAPPKPPDVTPPPATQPAPPPQTQPVKPAPQPGPATRPAPKPPATQPAPKPPAQPVKPPEPDKPDPINDSPSKPAGEAKDRLNEKFGAELKKAAGGAWKEAVELAGKLLEVAKALDYDPDLLTLLCEHAHTLGLKNPAGYEVAAEAMEFLAGEVPDKRLEALDKVITVRQKAFVAAKGLDKASALEDVLAALKEATKARLAQRDLPAAMKYLQQAQGLAASGRSPSLDDIKALNKEIQAADSAERQVKLAETRRKERGDDEMVKRSLLMPVFLDQDNPAEAEKLLYDKAEANLKKYVPLAAKPLAELSDEDCLELSGYYADLVEKASYFGRQSALRRAVLGYRSYLERHKTDDAEHKKAQAALVKAEKDLARFGDAATGLGVWKALLPLVNLKKDVAGAGKWTFNGCSLMPEGATPNTLVALPEKLLGNYEVRVRLVPLGDAVGDYLIDLPVGDRAVTLIISEKDGGLAKAARGPKAAAKNLAVDKACQITAKVVIGSKGVEISSNVDGLSYAKWTGQVGEVSPLLPDKKDPNGLPVIRVGTRSGMCRFRDVRVRMLSGQTLPQRPREAKGPLD